MWLDETKLAWPIGLDQQSIKALCIYVDRAHSRADTSGSIIHAFADQISINLHYIYRLKMDQ